MKKYILIGLLSLFLYETFIFQAYNQTSLDVNQPLPFDTSLVYDSLENGVSYYIRHNQKPKERINMQLVIKAGSVQEAETQRGLAHFTEHMCFNGTKRFEEQELVDFLEQMGIDFGPDLNAFTSLNLTAFKLQIPADNQGLKDTAFMVLEEWAHNVSFDKKEIDKERGVIVEEWRLGLGARDRLFRKMFPVIFQGSKYAERLPIGKMEVVKNFEYQTLIDFYNQWYRPDLTGVIVVGDISENYAKEKIKEHFAHIQMPENPKEKEKYEIPNVKQNIARVFTDKEALYSQFTIYFEKYKPDAIKTIKDYRDHVLIPMLCNSLISNRLKELQEITEGPFINTYTRRGRLFNIPVDVFRISGITKEGRVKDGLDTLFSEVQRIKLHGFTHSEIEREKKKLLKRFDELAKESGKISSSYYVSEYRRHFLHGDPIPGITIENEYAKALVPEITRKELNELAGKWMKGEHMITIVTAPENSTLPAEHEILEIIKASKQQQPEAYQDNVNEQPLLDTLLVGTNVIQKKHNDTFDYTEITLKNGVTVVLKPTNFKNDQILFTSISPGGHSLYPDDDYMSLKYLSNYINNSGLGQLDKLQLKKKLAGNTASVNFWLNDIAEGFTGSASPSDKETLLQLLYLYFTSPRKDSSALERILSKDESKYKYIHKNPRTVFYDTLQKIVTQNDPRTIPFPSSEQLNDVSMNTIYAIYKERVADASDYTFFFVGNFNMDSLIPYIEKYLGALPVKGQKEQWKDVTAEFPDGITNATIHKGTEPQSFVALVMNEPFDWSYEKTLEMNMLEKILSIRLRKKMREEESEVYGIRVNANASQFPKSEYTFSFVFGCNPAKTDTLVSIIFDEIENIQNSLPTDLEMQKAQNIFIRQRETKMEQNGFWLNQLEYKYFKGAELKTMDEYSQLVKQITAEDIKKAANHFLIPGHYVKLILKPETENR